ncbi:hypothetical protein [Guyparkeria halopsychrophila]|uniref:hypothetical protein n=1 Tax=Guyparkeria halopsychrophila TaxID=3139421 RepID=UPI0037C5A1C7
MLQTPDNAGTAPLDYLETRALDSDETTRALVDRLAQAERSLATWETEIDDTPTAVARRLDELETEVSDLESRLEDAEGEAETLRAQLREKETA